MTSRRYAEGTQVPVGRSRDEIERTLERFGATGQLWARDDELHVVTVAFARQGRTYRLRVGLPQSVDFQNTPTGRDRTATAAKEAYEAEIRRRFRSLANYIKAIMDAVDTGIITAEAGLLPYMMLPSGETVYERAQHQLGAGMDIDLSHALPERASSYRAT